VAEAECDWQDALALVVVDLFERHVFDAAGPERVQGADAVPERCDEDIGQAQARF
jgi:hypothetical protein